MEISSLVAPAISLLGLVMLTVSSAMPRARQHALLLGLSLAMAGGLLCLLVPLSVFPSWLLLLAGQAMAAPLLDRARHSGLVAACLVGALAIVLGHALALKFLLAYALPGQLQVVLASASLAGLAGSAMTRHHPTRGPEGDLPELALLAGAALFAGGLFFLPSVDAPMLAIAALSGGWSSLLLARRHDHAAPLRRVGEGLVAATLLALLAPLSPVLAVVAGVVASVLVIAGVRLAHRLHIDDAAHLLGMVLLPALGGLLLDGYGDTALALNALQWWLVVLALALAASLAWPLSMLVFGLRAGTRRVREGLDFQR
jgi:hypothetical protein